MRVVLRAAPRVNPCKEGQTAPKFGLLPRREPSFLASLAVSVALHAAVLETTPGLLLRAEYWRFRPPEVQKLMARTARATPLLVRVPDLPALEKLYLPAEKRQRTAAGSKARPAKAAPVQAARAEAPAAASSPPSALVLQPGRSAEPPKQLPPLKAMAVWSGPNPRHIEEPVLPGAREPGFEPAPARDRAILDAPEPAPPRLPSSLAPSEAMERARVYLPPSGSNPLTSPRQWLQEPEIPSAANTGTPAAFMILTPDRPKPGETITVPPGNLVVLGTGSGQAVAVASTAAASKPAAPENSKPASGATGGVRVARLEGKPAGTDAGAAAGSGLSGAAERNTRDRAADGGAPGAPEVAAPSGDAVSAASGSTGAKPVASARTIRTATGDIFALVEGDGSVTLTYPAGGAFDVVVVDASLPQPVAAHASALSGTPVYTAYLNVGQPVEWILHYCLPGGDGGARRQHSVVTLSAPKPLKAPYIVEAHLPPEPAWRWKGYQVFHAMLSSGGRLERLRALQAGGAAEALLDSLRRWTFRPAMLDGAPTTTEVLLVIPPFRQ